MLTTNQQNLNFGWNGVTHQALTRKAANKINKLNRNNKNTISYNVEKLISASVLPDKMHKDTPHIADIDFLEEINAYTMFKKFDKKAKTAYKQGNEEQFHTNIGKAIHYLQDMMCPPHCSAKKRTRTKAEMMNHKHFEDTTEKFQHDTIQEAKLEHKGIDTNLDDYIKNKMRNTKELKQKRESNKLNLKKTIIFSLKNGYDISFEYLNSVIKDLQK